MRPLEQRMAALVLATVATPAWADAAEMRLVATRPAVSPNQELPTVQPGIVPRRRCARLEYEPGRRLLQELEPPTGHGAELAAHRGTHRDPRPEHVSELVNQCVERSRLDSLLSSALEGQTR